MKHRKIFGKAVIVFMAVVMCLSSLIIVPVSAEETPTYEATEGWGAASDGIYYISSPQDLLAFAKAAGTDSASNTFNGKTVKLTKDIDLNPGWTAAKGASAPPNVWGVINDFQGTFDGQGHSISGIYAVKSTGIGFFWKAKGATIKNTRILNSYFASDMSVMTGGGMYMGVFAGSVSRKSYFENLYTNAIIETVSAPTSDAGATKNGNFYIGGILGGQYNADAEFTDCVYAGKIYTYYKGVGEIVGGVYVNTLTTKASALTSTLNNCVAYGTITLLESSYGKWNAVQCGMIGFAKGNAVLNDCIVYTISPSAAANYSGAVLYGDNNVADDVPTITMKDTYYVDYPSNANYIGSCAHPSRYNYNVVATFDGVEAVNATNNLAELKKSSRKFTSSDELRSKAAFASFEQINVGGKDYLIPESVANMQFGESHVAYAGYQLSTPADKLVNLRMVATTDTEPSKVGFEFTVTKGGKSGSDKVEATTVYTSILANYGTQEITAAELEGDYIYALVLGGISAEGDVTVSFRAYELAADGSVRYTAMRTVELTNGDDNVSN